MDFLDSTTINSRVLHCKTQNLERSIKQSLEAQEEILTTMWQLCRKVNPGHKRALFKDYIPVSFIKLSSLNQSYGDGSNPSQNRLMLRISFQKITEHRDILWHKPTHTHTLSKALIHFLL